MLKRVVKNCSQHAGKATSETQELKNLQGPSRRLSFAIGHPLSTMLDPPLQWDIYLRLSAVSTVTPYLKTVLKRAPTLLENTDLKKNYWKTVEL